MLFIGFFDGFLHDNRQLDKMNLFISANLSFPSLPRKQPRFLEKRKATGQLQVGTRPILPTEWIRG